MKDSLFSTLFNNTRTIKLLSLKLLKLKAVPNNGLLEKVFVVVQHQIPKLLLETVENDYFLEMQILSLKLGNLPGSVQIGKVHKLTFSPKLKPHCILIQVLFFSTQSR